MNDTGLLSENETRTTVKAPPDPALRDGLLLVDKHEGCTSHDVVAAARRLLRQKKIGHCGTLDPAATGLLLLTVGRATRLTRFLIRAPKIYLGTARLGISTDTYDTTGEVTAERPVPQLDRKTLDEAMAGFVGTQLQQPPPYCARKIGGVKYYELARRGEQVPDAKKEITIYDLKVVDPFVPGGHDVPFLLSCTSGTYARSVAHELGEVLGCGAALATLRRTRIGGFDLADALGLDALKSKLEAGEPLGGAWIPFDEVTLPFSEVVVDAQQEKRLLHGQTVLVRELDGQEGDWVKVRNQRRQFIAVGSVVERIGSGRVGVVQPKVVFQ
jgi:tRNA pseudouridine55 synthase